MSALPPKADIDRQSANVRFVPKADIASGPRHVRFTPLLEDEECLRLSEAGERPMHSGERGILGSRLGLCCAPFGLHLHNQSHRRRFGQSM